MVIPRITIAILSYNYERYIEIAIESAVRQKPGNYILQEILVVDDGSTDDTIRVIQKYPNVRCLYRRHEGFAATLSCVVEEARGEWIAFLDADDEFLPDKLKYISPFLNEENLLFLQHAEYVVDAEGKPFAEGTHPGGATSTLIVKRSAAKDLLPVTNEMFFHLLNDAGHGMKLKEPLTRYRVHDGSMTDRRTPGVFSDYVAVVCEAVTSRLLRMSEMPPSWASSSELFRLAGLYQAKALKFRERSRRERANIALPTTGEKFK